MFESIEKPEGEELTLVEARTARTVARKHHIADY